MATQEKTTAIPSDFHLARKAEDELLAELARRGYSKGSLFSIKLALEEGLNNAIKHGNRLDPKKIVELSYQVSKDCVVIRITDQGSGFDLGAVPDPTSDENLEKPCGRGIMLMRAYMDEVHFNADGNQVRMMKRNT